MPKMAIYAAGTVAEQATMDEFESIGRGLAAERVKITHSIDDLRRHLEVSIGWMTRSICRPAELKTAAREAASPRVVITEEPPASSTDHSPDSA